MREGLLGPRQDPRDDGERFFSHKAVKFVADADIDATVPARVCHRGRPTATDTGPCPAGKGDPVMAVSAPLVGLIVYADTLLEPTFAT